MGIDFESIMKFDDLVESNYKAYVVIKLDFESGFDAIGIFNTKQDADNCVGWLERNRPLNKGVYLKLRSSFKKFKGE